MPRLTYSRDLSVEGEALVPRVVFAAISLAAPVPISLAVTYVECRDWQCGPSHVSPRRVRVRFSTLPRHAQLSAFGRLLSPAWVASEPECPASATAPGPGPCLRKYSPAWAVLLGLGQAFRRPGWFDRAAFRNGSALESTPQANWCPKTDSAKPFRCKYPPCPSQVRGGLDRCSL